MEKIFEVIKGGDPAIIAAYMKENGFSIKDNKIVVNDDRMEFVKSRETFWDQRQQAR